MEQEYAENNKNYQSIDTKWRTLQAKYQKQ
jgi:hypothetical protein